MKIDRDFDKKQEIVNDAFLAVKRKYPNSKISFQKIIEYTPYCCVIQFGIDNNKSVFFNRHPLINGPIETSIYEQNQR